MYAKHGKIGFFETTAQISQKDELENNQLPTIDTPTAEYKDYLKERMTIFKAYPEREFERLYYAFLGVCKALNWYFDIGFDNEGIVCLHKEWVKAMPASDFKYPTVSLKQQSALLDSWISAAVMLSGQTQPCNHDL